MLVSDIYRRGPPQRLPALGPSGVRCVTIAKCEFLSPRPRVTPTGARSAFTGCQLREFMLHWANLTSSLYRLLSVPVREQERVF